MLYRETNAVCSEIHTKHTITLCGQNVKLLNVKLVVLCGQNVEFPMLNLVVHIVTAGLWKGSYFETRYDVRKYELRRNAPFTIL